MTTRSDLLQNDHNDALCQNKPAVFPKIRKKRKSVTRMETFFPSAPNDVFSSQSQQLHALLNIRLDSDVSLSRYAIDGDTGVQTGMKL